MGVPTPLSRKSVRPISVLELTINKVNASSVSTYGNSIIRRYMASFIAAKFGNVQNSRLQEPQ